MGTAPSSGKNIRVLSASIDAGLNRARALLLQDQGFEVATSESVEHASRKIAREEFDVLIFGSTLPRDVCWTLGEVFRKHRPAGRIIEILPSPWAAPRNNPDATVVSSDEPSALITTILQEMQP